MMSGSFVLFFSCALLTWSTPAASQKPAFNFWLNEFMQCPEHEKLPVKIYFHARDFDDHQLYDGNMTSTIDVDNSHKLTMHIDTLQSDGSWKFLFKLGDDHFCTSAEKYGAGLWDDLLTAINLKPKTCPIPAGTYHTVDFKPDFNKLNIPMVPFGKLRVTTTLHNEAGEMLGCYKIVFMNHLPKTK